MELEASHGLCGKGARELEGEGGRSSAECKYFYDAHLELKECIRNQCHSIAIASYNDSCIYR